jgi:hypothetical protein
VLSRTAVHHRRDCERHTAGSDRGAPTEAEAAFERTDGFVRCKLGPPAFAAGIMPEPTRSFKLSQVTQARVEWAGPLRPLGEVEIKKTIPVPRFVK